MAVGIFSVKKRYRVACYVSCGMLLAVMLSGCGSGCSPASDISRAASSSGRTPDSNPPSSPPPPSPPDRMTLEREIARPDAATLQVTVHIRYGGQQPVTALGLVENIPPGWRYRQAAGTALPQILPQAGREGRLEFVWITPPPFPANFTYTLEKTAGKEDSAAAIRGQTVYRRLGGEERSDELATSIPGIPQ